MKHQVQNLMVSTGAVDRRYVKVVALVSTLVLFVLSAGAPLISGCPTC
jgi:hypothetical protein